MTAFLSGFALSLSFIVAIGAQNALVLRQGIRREHVLLVVLACSISEVILVFMGVAGFGVLSEAAPWFSDVMRYGGAVFLIAYGANAIRSALNGTGALEAGTQGEASWQSVLAAILGVTWLNPHAILDTVVLIGSISMQYGADRYVFGAGTVVASVLFFFALGYGARFLAPIFARPRAWQILDGLVGITMWVIAAGLIFSE
ncbi:MAG: LysE/ArgO family amino acid transporter [Litoreibacter sp.]